MIALFLLVLYSTSCGVHSEGQHVHIEPLTDNGSFQPGVTWFHVLLFSTTLQIQTLTSRVFTVLVLKVLSGVDNKVYVPLTCGAAYQNQSVFWKKDGERTTKFILSVRRRRLVHVSHWSGKKPVHHWVESYSWEKKSKSISSISFSVIVVEDRSGLQAGQSAAVSPLYTDYYWLQKLTELYFSCYRTKEIKPLFHLFPLFPFGHRYRKYQNRNSRALFCVRPAITLRPIKGVHPHFENHWHRPRPWWMLPVHAVVIMMNEKTNSSTNCWTCRGFSVTFVTL